MLPGLEFPSVREQSIKEIWYESQGFNMYRGDSWMKDPCKTCPEKEKDFGEKFIKLSRDVHFLNDDRAKIKLEINNHTGSKIKEIKEYTKY